jgi:hypothetical protein
MTWQILIGDLALSLADEEIVLLKIFFWKNPLKKSNR